MDRANISNRNATFVLGAVAQSVGQDLTSIALNRESIRRARRQQREKIATDIKSAFDPSDSLVIHFDGKILPTLTKTEHVDRQAVLVSGNGNLKLLGVPQLLKGTGKMIAEAIYDLLNGWNLSNRVQFMCFDTTASNTGLKKWCMCVIRNKIRTSIVKIGLSASYF